ncbi:MAG: DedA family protein/thiosulfate sulfurtransferase GlpE [Alphaproteobacteria bacterium]
MHLLLDLIQRYGLIAVFVSTLIDNIGLPIPSYPVLMVSAATVATLPAYGQLLQILAVGVMGSFIADIALYWAGRRHGLKIVGLLCKISLSPDSCVRNTGTMFARLGIAALPLTKFFPGISTMAVVLAGATKMSLRAFLILDMLGSVIYVGGGLLLGVIFHSAIDDALAALSRWGQWGLVIISLLLGMYLLGKWWQRHKLIRQLRMDRITVKELRNLIDGGQTPTILDARAPEARALQGTIPGSLLADEVKLQPLAEQLSPDREIIVYCSCPNEVSAALVARDLKKSGFRRVRPLLGGIEAWKTAGYVIETGLEKAAA